jgi:hypothetical protein
VAGECTIDSTSDYTLWTLYRTYFKSISANIVLQLYSVTCCLPYRQYFYIHTTHALSPKGYKMHLRYYSETSTLYQNYLAMRNTGDVTGGKPIVVRSQSISDVSAVNPLVAFYDIHGRKGEVLFFCSVPDTTRDLISRGERLFGVSDI